MFSERTDDSVVIFMLILFGFGFSCFATTMWTSIARLSGHANSGMGNGLAFFSYAIQYAIAQYIVGALTYPEMGAAYKYYYVSWFLLCIAVVIIVCGVLLVIDDFGRWGRFLWRKH
jgi:hypothetical protein